MPPRPRVPDRRLRRIAEGASRRGRTLAPMLGLLPLLMLVLVFVGIATLGGCRSGDALDPSLREPALLVDGAALTRLLRRSEGLEETPLGHRSKTLLARLSTCTEVAADFGPGFGADANTGANAKANANTTLAGSAAPRIDPLNALVCREPTTLDPALAKALSTGRGDHDGLLQWPIGPAGRLALVFDVDERGGLNVAGTLEGGEGLGTLSLLVPDAAPPAKALLADAASLVHLQVRPAGGVALSALVPAGSQGDRLFAMKGRLLEGALLEGTLELALVPPAANGHVPLPLVALHHRSAAPVEAAVGEVLARLEKTWGIVPTRRAFTTAAGERAGGCYAALPLLPEFAPCWLVGDDALLVGYRAEAIEAALASAKTPGSKTAPSGPLLPAEAMSRREARDALPVSAAPPRASRLLVDFDGFRAADRLRHSDDATTRLADLYARLEIEGHREPGGPVRIEARLRARP